MPKPGTPRPAPSPTDAFAAKAISHPNTKRVLFEGDSWLAYPRGNLVESITARYKINALDLSANGDELVNMVAGPQRKKLRDILNCFDFAAIVISGGGNDIVGPDLFPLLRDFKDSYAPADCIDRVALDRRLTMMSLAFWEIATLRDYHDAGATIVTHTYDYAIPNGKGFDFVIKNIAGPWLAPAMGKEGRRIKDDLPFRCEIVRLLIDAYAAKLLQLASEIPNFRVVDSRNTLHGEEEWDNELHPTRKCFTKIVDTHWTTVLDPLLKP